MTRAALMTDFWMLPWNTTTLVQQMAETVVATQTVRTARLPKIAEAVANPLVADHGEMALMMSEKVEAFGRSGSSITTAAATIEHALSANARDLGRATGGDILSPSDWIGIAQRTMLVAATLMALPSEALAPVRSKVKSNAKRLRRG